MAHTPKDERFRADRPECMAVSAAEGVSRRCGLRPIEHQHTERFSRSSAGTGADRQPVSLRAGGSTRPWAGLFITAAITGELDRDRPDADRPDLAVAYALA